MPNTNGQRAGGRRGLSIRRLLYFLVAIPLLTVIGLYAFVLYTTVGDAVNLDRGPNLINATSLPAAQFSLFIQAERRASMIYLVAPTAANRAQLTAAQDATVQNFATFRSQMTSAATTQAATTAETNAINKMIGEAQQLSAFRPQVIARAVLPATVMATYSGILTSELSLFVDETLSLTNAPTEAQSEANTIAVAGHEALSQEDAVVSAALAAHQVTAATRIQVAQLAGARQGLIQNSVAWFNANDTAGWNSGVNRYAPPATLAQLGQLEDAFAADTTPFPPFTAAQWDPVANAALAGYFAGGVNVAHAQVHEDGVITNAAWRRVALSGGLGLLGLLLSIGLSVLIGRFIIRRLGRLEESAVTLASVELPGVVARLRRGEDVPVEELSGTAEDFGGDEIGRVGQAFEEARRTAIEAAVGEARMRRGINDVFRNLARRNQSLLHRELTVLDGMERRTTDPETLEDLFRLDHLTTRMRRHSEGLIILSGAAPGRGWVHPVRMIDVLRAAAAEVEDYSRVSVTTPSQAALTGPAVADVIHLLAELIENATSLSPPYTPVRVSGDMVASGFAVEIEDRGLGMSEQRYAELNGRLLEPPEFDVFNSEQLGLFVVGQLAKRHGIRVTLRPSPYGGTSAIALIPTTLVGMEDGFVEGLPAGMTAISSAWPAGRGDMPSADTTAPPSSSRGQLTGQPWSALPQGNGSSGPVNGDARVAGGQDPFGSFAAGQAAGTEPYADQSYGGPANGVPSSMGAGGSFGEQPYGTDPNTGQPYGWRSPADGPSIGAPGDPDPEPTETGLPWPYDRPAPGANGAGQHPTAPFASGGPGYTPGSTYRPYTQDETPFPPPGAPLAPPEAPLPAAEPPYPQAQPSYSEIEPAFPSASTPYSRAEAAYPTAEPAVPLAGSHRGQDGIQEQQDDETYKGLPKRVRQASLAPQLRDRTTPSGTASAASGDNVANRSPDDIRNALSAMQRGWQQGRADQGGSPGQDGSSGANRAHAANGNLTGSGDEGTVPGEERFVTDEERSSAQGSDGNGNGNGYGGGYSSDAGYGTADRYGVGNVGYPDYSAEPGGETGHETEASSSHDTQSYSGGNDDI
jgi:signal transduction histidine kinase